MALVFALLMLQQMFSGGAMGGSVASLVSRALGAGQTARAEALVVHALGSAVVAGRVTSLGMLALSDAVIGLLGGRGEPLAQAVAYVHVAFLGSTGVWLLDTLSAVLRATGNMLVPSAILIAVGLTQVALAGVFGLGAGPIPPLGMPGIALGQVLAYAMGTVVLGWYVCTGKARIRLRLRGATWLVTRSGPQALAGTLRLLLVAGGGAALVAMQAPAWAIFALVAVGMAAHGTASILLVHHTPWEPPLLPAPA